MPVDDRRQAPREALTAKSAKTLKKADRRKFGVI
jgi:hypothetical protein